MMSCPKLTVDMIVCWCALFRPRKRAHAHNYVSNNANRVGEWHAEIFKRAFVCRPPGNGEQAITVQKDKAVSAVGTGNVCSRES